MPLALTIGTFDGVHLGHAELLRRCRAHVGIDGCVIALAFDPHPLTVLRPEAAPARLTTFERKSHYLLSAGADEVFRLAPTQDLLNQSPEQFLRSICEKFHPSLIVEGRDFRFGKGRAGDTRTLESLGPSLGFATQVADHVQVPLADQLLAPASSSLVRWLLSQGRTLDASLVLGHPFELEGAVVPGDRRGRTIGIPTCNLDTPCMLPADGVYAGLARLPGGERIPAAINIGARPTVAGVERRAEAHLLLGDPPRTWQPLDGLPEYGWPLRVQLLAFVRDQVQFPSFEHLREQISRDLARVREIVPRSQPEKVTA